MEYTVLACVFTVYILRVTEGLMQDLTHYYDSHVIRWPGHKPWVYNLNRGPIKTGTNKTAWLESNDLSTAEHMGTHIDAPAHLYRGMKRLDEIPLSDLIAPMVVIDVQEQAKNDRDYAMSIEDVMNFEKKHGEIPEGAAVFMYSGWDKYWFSHDRNAYLGTSSDDIWSLHHPGFHADTAEWLITNRNIKGIGADCVSFDIGQALDFEVHTTIFARNIWGLENLANLAKAPPRGAVVHVMPMNIYQASGAPSRVVAFWGDDAAVAHLHSGAPCTQWCVLTTLLLAALAALIHTHQ